MENTVIDRNLNEIDALVGSMFTFYLDKDYDSVICCLEDMQNIAGNKLIPAFEELLDSESP